MLTYHVVPGKRARGRRREAETAKTVSGDTITVRVSGGRVTVDDADVIKTDVMASNGVIHVIDTVLMPKGL